MINLTDKAFELRKEVIDLIYKHRCGHMGGDLSVMDILVTLYYDQMNVIKCGIHDKNRDRFILSKGHSVESLYVVLADCGFFPKEELETFSKYQSKYIGHPNNKVSGVEMNSGSLGHGLSVGCGMAKAAKMDNLDYRTYVVMGDGELAEGSVWEGAMFGGHYKLDNLCAVIDYNGLQISGTTKEVMSQEQQKERWLSFGWHVIEINGNSTKELKAAFDEAKTVKGKPTMIIAYTTKGYGVSFMENKAVWHHRVPTEEEYIAAMKELDERRKGYASNS